MSSATPAQLSVRGKTAPSGDVSARSQHQHSVDATQERRPLPPNQASPGSFAEREAMLLLDKINEINKIEKAPKQPCQKMQLKRFHEEMMEDAA